MKDRADYIVFRSKKASSDGEGSHRLFYEGFMPDSEMILPLKDSLKYLHKGLDFLTETSALFATLPISAISPDGLIGGKGFILPVSAIRETLSRVSMDLMVVIDTLTDELHNPLYLKALLPAVERVLERPLEEDEKEMLSFPDRFGLGEEGQEQASFMKFPQNLDKTVEQGGTIDPNLAYQVKGEPGEKYFIGLDTGYTDNGFGIAIVHYDAPVIVLDFSIVFYPGEPPFENINTLPPDQIADFIADLYSRFDVVGGITDQWEAISLLNLLKDRGITNIQKIGLTRDLKSKMFEDFRDRVYRGEFRMPKDSSLVDELKNLEINPIEGSDNYSVDADESGPYGDDLTDAVVRAVWFCDQVIKRSKMLKKRRFDNLLDGEPDDIADKVRYVNRDMLMERADSLVDQYLTRNSKKMKRIAAVEEEVREQQELRRKRPEGFSYNEKVAHGVFAVMVMASKALIFLYKAISKLSSIPASSISPDGNLGGEGYVLPINDVRRILNKAANDLAKISDTLADEVRNPNYELDTEKLFDLASKELEEFQRDEVVDDDNNFSEIMQGESYKKQDDDVNQKVIDSLEPNEPEEGDDFSGSMDNEFINWNLDKD